MSDVVCIPDAVFAWTVVADAAYIGIVVTVAGFLSLFFFLLFFMFTQHVARSGLQVVEGEYPIAVRDRRYVNNKVFCRKIQNSHRIKGVDVGTYDALERSGG